MTIEGPCRGLQRAYSSV